MINKNISIIHKITSSDEISINKVKSNLVIINNTIVMKSFPDIESCLCEYEAFQTADKLDLYIPT